MNDKPLSIKGVPQVERIAYNSDPKQPKVDNQWLSTTKNYYRWKKTEGFTKWQRKQFLRQGGTCYYCDEPLSGAKQNVDHVVPRSRGGGNNRNNLVIACWRCNKHKYTNLLSKKKRIELKTKNKKKRGTYTALRESMPTEEELAYRLKQMFRED